MKQTLNSEEIMAIPYFLPKQQLSALKRPKNGQWVYKDVLMLYQWVLCRWNACLTKAIQQKAEEID